MPGDAEAPTRERAEEGRLSHVDDNTDKLDEGKRRKEQEEDTPAAEKEEYTLTAWKEKHSPTTRKKNKPKSGQELHIQFIDKTTGVSAETELSQDVPAKRAQETPVGR